MTKLRTFGCLLIVVMTIALSFSTALISVTELLVLVVFCLLFILERETRVEVVGILKQPVVLVGLVLLILMIIRMTLMPDEATRGWGYLVKYRELILFPMLLLLLNKLHWKKRVYYTFLTVMGAVVMHSWLQYLGLMPQLKLDQPNTSMVGRIGGAVMLAFACYAYLEESFRYKKNNSLVSAMFLLLFILSSIDLLFLFNGRTGIIIYLSIGLMWAWRYFGFRGILFAAIVFLFGVALAVYSMPSLEERYLYTLSEFNSLGQADFSRYVDSRADFYSKTAHLLPNVLPFGGGPGSFAIDVVAAHLPLQVNFSNPHNEYLLILYESGIIGLVLFSSMLIFAWRCASFENEREKWLIRALVVTMAVGCCFNSLLLDIKEAHFYVLMLSSLIGVARLQRGVV